MKLFMPLYELLVGSVVLCIDYLTCQFNLLKQYQSFILMAGISLVILALVSIGLLSKRRGFGNYLKSLIDTGRLRSFLHQQNTINDFTSTPRVDVDQRIYNSTLRYTYIDYSKDLMQVWVCIPNSVKAKKMLDDNLTDLAQEVNSYSDKYILSSHTRKGSFYIYQGVRK